MHPQSQKARLSPSLISRSSYSGLSLALALCLLCPALPAVAADDDEAALARAEKILFGDQSQEGDLQDRIERVEKRIFGRHKGGSDEERVERITSTLLIDRKKLKVNKKAEEPPKPVAEPAAQASATSGSQTAGEAAALAPLESTAQTQPESVTQTPPEPAAQSQAEAKQPTEPIVASPAPPAEESQQVKVGEQQADQKAPEASKVPVLKANGKQVVKRGQHKMYAAESKRQTTAKKTEITLTPEKAALDARKPEKRPSALDTPVTYSSTGSNRISRGSAKVSQATALLREGMEAHRKGEDAKAEQLFKRVVLMEPRNPDGYFNLGALAEKKNDLAGALMSYRAALNVSPNDRELKEAVDSLEAQLGLETTGGSRVAAGSRANGTRGSRSHEPAVSSSPPERETEEARRAEIRDYYGRTNDREGGSRESVAREQRFESSDRFQTQPGEHGFGASANSGPHPAPNFYRARAKTTREIQEEAAPFVDVTDPDAPQMSVSQPQPPVVNTSQPQPFQLQTQRNQNATQAIQNRHPSVAGTATRAILGAALSVGTSYALRSTGLHCPICRIGGGGALRGLLRF